MYSIGNWDEEHWGNRYSCFSISDFATDRLRQFLASPERSAAIPNINNYWLTRRLNLSFIVEPNAVGILRDTNLSSRITDYDRNRIRRLAAVPEPLLASLKRILLRSYRWLARVERFLELQRIGKEIRLAQDLTSSASKTTFPFGSLTEEQLRSAPVSVLLESWPERTLLMLHAVDVIQHFAPFRVAGWRVLEIGSGPCLLTGLLMHNYGSKHMLVDLPEQIAVGFALLSEFWPHKRFLLPHEIENLKKAAAENDAVFLTPTQLPLPHALQFDVAINTFSFQEMSPETIAQYFSLIRRHLTPDGVFYCANRRSKRNPHDDTIAEFAKYPWHPHDQFLFDRDMRAVPGASEIHRECVVRLASERNSSYECVTLHPAQAQKTC
jgi:putative sugar O-methyltransferase